MFVYVYVRTAHWAHFLNYVWQVRIVRVSKDSLVITAAYPHTCVLIHPEATAIWARFFYSDIGTVSQDC